MYVLVVDVVINSLINFVRLGMLYVNYWFEVFVYYVGSMVRDFVVLSYV